jgi:glycosyltransferase involved in cell wall biosynthesis
VEQNNWLKRKLLVNGKLMPAKIAYIVSRFPTVTETFILYEILELKRLGINIEIFPLLRQNEPVIHAEVEELKENIHYSSVFSYSTLLAQLHFLIKRPGKYIGVWWRVILGNLSSLKFLTRVLVTLPLAVKFAFQMERFGVEHIHAHWATHPTLAAYVIRKLTNLTYSFTAHAHDIFVERLMLGEKIAESSFLITISEYNRKILYDLYGDIAVKKTLVVRCGVDLNTFQPRKTRKSNGTFTIICIASLKDYKGHMYLLRACSQLKINGVDFCCLLIGDGYMRDQIEANIVQLELSDNVKLLGFQSRHQVKYLLTTADVMVLPSVVVTSGKKEGIPVALMEALAIELPVISTAISGIPELIEDGVTGLLVPERNARALVTAIMKVYHLPEFASELGKAGRAKIVQDYNLQTNVKKLYTLFIQNWVDIDISPLEFFESGTISDGQI